MAKLRWVMFCEKALIDSRTNNVSLIDVVEEITVPKVPVVIPNPFFIVSLWVRDAVRKNELEKVDYRIMLVTPKKKEKQLIKYKFQMEKKRHRTLNGIFGLPIEHEGIHYFSVQQLKNEKWKEEIRVLFDIKIK